MVRIGLPRNRGAADIGVSTITEGGLRHNGEKGAFSGDPAHGRLSAVVP